MSEARSARLRKERQRTWFELEGLVLKAEAEGLRALSPDELTRLPILYRATLSSLNIAREISLDTGLLTYLESLASRAYVLIYGTRKPLTEVVRDFLNHDFPRAVRDARWWILAATLLMGVGGALAFHLVLVDPMHYYAFVPAEMAGGRTPSATTESLRAALYDSAHTDDLAIFSSFLATHNAKIGLTCFSLGIAFAVPVVYLLFYNGMVLGAFVGLYASRGLTLEVLAWILPHGVTELLAVILCGAAGMALGTAAAFPGTMNRWDNVKLQMRRVGPMVVGAVGMFFVAALVEGFFRQLVQDQGVRWLVAGSSAVWWSLYFVVGGRR